MEYEDKAVYGGVNGAGAVIDSAGLTLNKDELPQLEFTCVISSRLHNAYNPGEGHENVSSERVTQRLLLAPGETYAQRRGIAFDQLKQLGIEVPYDEEGEYLALFAEGVPGSVIDQLIGKEVYLQAKGKYLNLFFARPKQKGMTQAEILAKFKITGDKIKAQTAAAAKK